MSNPTSPDVTTNLRDISNDLFAREAMRLFGADESSFSTYFRKANGSGNVDTSTSCASPSSC